MPALQDDKLFFFVLPKVYSSGRHIYYGLWFVACELLVLPVLAIIFLVLHTFLNNKVCIINIDFFAGLA